MRHRITSTAVAVLFLAAFTPLLATAVLIEEQVTPDSIKQEHKRFAIKAERHKDGLIHFTITYRTPGPRYLVSHFELRDDKAVLAKTDSTAFVRESSTTYYVAVAPDQLSRAKFELSEHGFADSGGEPIAIPGGTVYQIQLEAFGKNAVRSSD